MSETQGPSPQEPSKPSTTNGQLPLQPSSSQSSERATDAAAGGKDTNEANKARFRNVAKNVLSTQAGQELRTASQGAAGAGTNERLASSPKPNGASSSPEKIPNGTSPPANTTPAVAKDAPGSTTTATTPATVTTNGNSGKSSNDDEIAPQDMKSRAIYDIARTKILTQRSLIRLSTETGFIKLRAKPAPRSAATAGAANSNSSTVNGAAPSATQPSTAASKEGEVNKENGEKAKKPSVAGWKEQGALDAGKKPSGQQQQQQQEGSIMDTINMYLDMVDRNYMWRNCAGVFGLIFLTYLLTTLNFGIFGVTIAAAFGAQWYRNSVIRFRRSTRDDIVRAHESSTLTRTLESVGWLNEFTTRFWLMFEPSLSRMVIDIADPILAQNTPGFLDSLQLTTFTLGTKAPRIDGVRTYSEIEDRNVIVMDWMASFTPNDLSDVPPVLRENRVNPKVVLTVRVGKGVVGADIPILVEDMVFRGKMQVRLQLGSVFPHVRTADVCFLERPTIDFVLKPVGGETFGFDIAHVPGLRTFILDTMHATIGPMFYAPNHFTVDVEQIISGAVANIDSAIGVLIITMHSARGLPKMDTFGKADPYVKISSIKHPEKVVRTRMIEKTLAPTWDETLILLIYSKTDTIQFEVFDWNAVGKDDKIGFIHFPMQKMLEQPELEGVTMPIKMGESERGQLTYDMSYFPVATRTTQAAAVDENGNPLAPEEEAAAAAEEDISAQDDQQQVDSNTGILRLFVRSASDLAKSPAHAKRLCVRADAYIGKNRVIECPEAKNTDAPQWEVGKEIFVPDRDCAVIRLRLVDCNNNKTMGTLKLSVEDAIAHQSGDTGSDWYSIEGHPKGKVRVNVKWRPILMDPDMASSLGQGKKMPSAPIGFVKLTCHQGRNLKNVESAGNKSDSYVRVMIQNQVIAKTRYIADNLNPIWDETLFVPIHRINETLALECMDWNRVERHKPLGEAMLNVSRLIGKPTKDEFGDLCYVKKDPVEMWAGLRQRNGKIKGEIRFRASFVPAINFDTLLNEEEKARGMIDMKISDNEFRLGEEEPVSDDDSSSSSSSSSSSDEDEDNHKKQEPNGLSEKPKNSLSRSANPIKLASSAKTHVVDGVTKTTDGAAKAINSVPGNIGIGSTNGDLNELPASIFSGKTTATRSGISQTLSRYPQLPNIDYTQFDSGVLTIAIIGCRGLLRPFAGVFVDAYLDGNKQSPLVQTEPSRRRGREHMWDDELAQAAIPESKFNIITFDVKCRPAGVRGDSEDMISIGKADFSMSELVEQKLVNSSEPVWLPLDSDTGEILVFLRYDPVEDPELLPNESITNQGQFRIRVDSASNLPAADKSGTSDPYVVAMINDVKVWKTEPVKKNLNPKWNEQTLIDVRSREKTTLKLEIYDWNQIQSHTLLGTVNIPLSEVPINQGLSKDYPLDSSGKSTIRIQFLFKPMYVEQHDDSSPVLLNVAQTVVAAPVTVIKGGATVVGSVVGGLFNKLGGKNKHKKSKDDEANERLSPAATQAMMEAINMPGDEGMDAAKSSASLAGSNPGSPRFSPQGVRSRGFSTVSVSSNIESFPGPGMLNITINGAKLNSKKNRNMMAVVEMNGKTLHKSRVEKDVTSAQWDEKFSLPVLQGSSPALSVFIKDHSSFRSDKSVSEFQLKVFDMLKDQIVSSGGARADLQNAVLDSEDGSLTVSVEFLGSDSSNSINGSVVGLDASTAQMNSQGSGDKYNSVGSKSGVLHRRRSSVFSKKSSK